MGICRASWFNTMYTGNVNLLHYAMYIVWIQLSLTKITNMFVDITVSCSIKKKVK